jgi:hypothetical protein
MKRIIGTIIGLGYVVLAFVAFRTSAGGWANGHTDIGFWWIVIGSFLSIAALGAIAGTMLHTRAQER